MKPSDWKVAPDELFPTERVRDFLEWSLLRNWMKDWLRYVHWYWSVANSPDVSLSDFFSASVYEKEWRIRRESSELPYSYKGRRKECSAHLSYGSLPQRSFTPSASSIQKGSVFFLFLLVNSVLKRRHYWRKEMAGRSIALGRRCRTCLNRKCIRYSIPSSIPPWFQSVYLFFTFKWEGGWQRVYFLLYVAVSSMSVDW